MKGKVATITLNPAYDLVGMVDNIEKGAVNLVKNHGLYPAGKGINVTNTLKNLNVHVTIGGFLGKENLNGFQHNFKKRGITNRFHIIEGRTRINFKLTEKGSLPKGIDLDDFTDWMK